METGPPFRGRPWLFFLAGISGTAMIATGLVLWSVKRAEKSKAEARPFFHRLVDHLNVGAVAGLTVAVAVYFWFNRLLPVDMAARPDWEIRCFFIAWLVTFLHPLVRPLKRAWIEQLVLAGALFAAISVLNLATTHSHLGVSLPRGQWLVASFDLVAFMVGVALLHVAVRILRHKGRARPARRPAPGGAVPAAAE